MMSSYCTRSRWDLRANKSFILKTFNTTFSKQNHRSRPTPEEALEEVRGQRSEVTVPSTYLWMKREMMESRNTGAAERSFFYFFTAGWRRRGRNWRREDDWGGRRRGRVVLLEQMSFQPPTLRVTVRFWLEWEGHFSPEWDGRTGPRTDEGKSSFISWSELGRSQDKFKKVSGVFPASCGSLQRNSQFHLWLYFGYSIGIKCRRVYLNRSVTTCVGHSSLKTCSWIQNHFYH